MSGHHSDFKPVSWDEFMEVTRKVLLAKSTGHVA